MPITGTRVTGHIAREAAALLRALLLCQLVEHTDQRRQCLATVEELTGERDSDSVLERELAEASALQFGDAMQEARDALQRLDDGTFGMCETCKEPIPLARLQAMPHSRRCVTCSVVSPPAR